MSNVKYLEMEDIAYKEWSDHLDFVASSRASPWLPAYGYHPPSPIQEIFNEQPDSFMSDNSPGQQQYLVLETILEETSDDLCSESDKSGPAGWNSDSDADSVIHVPKMTENGADWRARGSIEEIPKKRRRRIADKISLSDDDEPRENVESNSLSSRSSSLIAFESLEKHCEDVFVTNASDDPFNRGSRSDSFRESRARSSDGSGEVEDGFDSSDDERSYGSSADILRLVGRSTRGGRRPFAASAAAADDDPRLRSYGSFDSLNLFENLSPLDYAMAELSQSQSALDDEKAKLEEREFVTRDKKLTATTADLSIMTDAYELGSFSGKNNCLSHRRGRGDVAGFHYVDVSGFRNAATEIAGADHPVKHGFLSFERKSYGAEGSKCRLSIIREDSGKDGRVERQPKSHPSVENLSEDSGFDDPSSAKEKMNSVEIGRDENRSSAESSCFSECNASEEGSCESSEGREHSKWVNKDCGDLKITETKKAEAEAEAGIEAAGTATVEDDVRVIFNSSQSQTHMSNCTGEEGPSFEQEEVGTLIATPSVTFASLARHQSNDPFRDVDVRPRPEFKTFFKTENPVKTEDDFKNKFSFEDELRVSRKADEFLYGAAMNRKTKRTPTPSDSNRQIVSRLPVLSTPNLFVSDEDFARGKVPSAASSLTHVPLKDDEDGDDDADDDAEYVNRYGNKLPDSGNDGGFGGSLSSAGIKGVHFCPVVSEVSWQDSYGEDGSSGNSSDPSTDEISNRSLEELCEMENYDEEFHEVEEKSIPRERIRSERTNPSETVREDAVDGAADGVVKPDNCPNVKDSSDGNKPRAEKKRVTPTIRVTPTSFGHVFVSDAAQPNVEKITRLSVSESSLPTQDHAIEERRRSDRYFSSGSVASPSSGPAMKKSKSRFGGFFERFSLRRLSSRKSSDGSSKNRDGKNTERVREVCDGGGGGGNIAATTAGGREDVTIIPLHGPENEAEMKEIFRSVVTPHVVSKPPLPPSDLQRMSGGSRKRFPPSGTASVGSQDEGPNEKENMPGVRENVATDDDRTNDRPLTGPSGDAEPLFDTCDKPVGLLETDLDTHVTVESAGRRPSVQNNVVAGKKARSLMNLGLGDSSVHRDGRRAVPSAYLEPPSRRSHGSVDVDDRAKSMEFLLDKENQAAILPPENELQKGGTCERVMSEHQLRVQKSLQKLNVPEWYKSSAVSQTPQGFILKRNSGKEHRGWPGLASKTTSLSSLGSSQSAVARSPTGHAFGPSPTSGHSFTRWSTSRLNSGINSSSTSPSGSARSSFNYRQPYLGWRSQEKLTRPRTPAERLAAGLLPLQKQPSVQYNSQENGSKEEAPGSGHSGASPGLGPKRRPSSPRSSSGRLCWLESSFVGSRPLDQPETPVGLVDPSASVEPPEPRPVAGELYLDLKPRSEINHVTPRRLNEGTPTEMGRNEEPEFEKAFEVRTRPSPASTTLDDVLESLLGLPPASRSPSPGPLSVTSAAASSPGRIRPLLPLPERQHQRHSCGDIRANVSGSASDPGNDSLAKEATTTCRRKSEGNGEWTPFERKGKKFGKDEMTKKELHSQLAETLVKCRYSKCGKTATVLDAKRTFKTCHNCSHVYCSRECRRAHWERHRRTCLHSRVGALCRQVLATAKEDAKALHHLSLLARRGYLTHGRGAVKIFFSCPEMAEKFVSRGFDDLGEPAYVKWSDLLPAEMGADLFAELMKICKSYNPDTRLVLYVAICVVSEVPTTGAVKWERQLVSRCCKIRLDKSLVPPKMDKDVPPPLPPRRSSSECVNITREMENPDTLILTSLPGIAGKVPEQKIREISFTNIQRELKQRGVSLRRQFPEVYRKLCSYVEGTSEHFTPVTIYPRDAISGKTFMCIIMPDSEPEKLEMVPKDSTKVQTIDVSMERKIN